MTRAHRPWAVHEPAPEQTQAHAHAAPAAPVRLDRAGVGRRHLACGSGAAFRAAADQRIPDRAPGIGLAAMRGRLRSDLSLVNVLLIVYERAAGTVRQ